MKYFILDDVLPKKFVDYVENKFINFPYYYLRNITDINSNEYMPGFSHQIADFYRNKGVIGDGFDLVQLLLYTFAQRTPIVPNNILQSRLFLQLPTVRETISNLPHRDVEIDHMVFLYYVFDSDGPTVLYDKTSRYDYEQNVLISIEPKKGRGVFFNGKYYHNSSSPTTKSTRLILNVDFT